MLTKINELMGGFRKCGGGVNGTLNLWQERAGICGKFKLFCDVSQVADSSLSRVHIETESCAADEKRIGQTKLYPGR